MAEGVTADVNSHRKMMRRDWSHVSLSPERTRMRTTYPKSRIAIHNSATNNQNTVFHVKVIISNAFGSNSLYSI